MKKTKIVIGIAIALGISWLGGTWYTSKQISEKYQSTFNNVNTLLKTQLSQYSQTNSFSIKFENIKADLGFFSSTIHYDLILSNKSGKTLSIPFISKVYNGPLPLNRLIKGRIYPEGYSIETELQNTEATKTLFQATNNQPPLKINSDLDFTGNSQSTFKIQQGNYDNFNWSNSSGELDLYNNFTSKNFSLDQLDLNFISQSHNQSASINIKNLEYALNTEKTEWEYLPNYQDQFHLDQLSLTYFDYPRTPKIELNFNNINSSSDQRLNGRFSNGKINSTIDSITLNGHNLGKFTQNLLAEHFDAQATNQLIAQNTDNNSNLFNQSQRLEPILQSILSNKAKIEIDPISLRNREGEVRFSLQATSNSDANLSKDNLANLFSDFTLKFKIDKPALTTWIKDIATALPELNLPTNNKEIESMLKIILFYAINQNMLIETENEFKSELKVKDGTFYLNDQPQPTSLNYFN